MLAQATSTLGGLLAAYNGHDAAGFAAQFAVDGVLRILPTEDVARGREEIKALLDSEFKAFPDSRLERREVHACAAVTWLEWTITGTHAGEYMGHRATYRGFELHGCSRISFAADGLIAEEALYFDPATTLRQLGLAPNARPAR
jgi:steroid delta-isomerase-like uncharacterized protein